MKLYESKTPFLLSILYYSSYKSLLKQYKINRRIKGLFNELYVSLIELRIKNLCKPKRLLYSLKIDTLKLNIDIKDEIEYIQAKNKLYLHKLRCKTLYTCRLYPKIDSKEMPLPSELESLYFRHKEPVVINSPCLKYIKIVDLAYNNDFELKDCGDKLHLCLEGCVFNSINVDVKLRERVEILEMSMIHWGVMWYYNNVKEIHVIYDFYEACKYANKCKVYLHKRNSNIDRIIEELKVIDNFDYVATNSVTLVDEAELIEGKGKETEFKSGKECLLYLLSLKKDGF